MIRVVYCLSDSCFEATGLTVATVRDYLACLWGVRDDAVPLVDGREVAEDHVLREGEELDFAPCRIGHKGMGDTYTDEELTQKLKIVTADLDVLEVQGLPCLRINGQRRWTETAVDEFLRCRVVVTPWLTVEEAARYARTSVKGIYAMIERGKLKNPEGSSRALFTKEMLDAAIKGE